MAIAPIPTCDRCGEFRQRILTLEAELDQARAKIEDLQEQLAVARTDSSTSHKPPSSDIVKPSPDSTAEASPRARGAQPGHPHHQRPPFPPELLTGCFDHAYSCCPQCGGPVDTGAVPARVVQQLDVPQIPHSIEEHRSFESWCPQCQKHYTHPLPALIDQGGLFGPYLRTLVAYLKGACHASFSTIRKYFRDVLQIKVSRGYLAKVIRQVSDALQEPYDELLSHLKNAPVVNSDETGHPHAGENWWTWVFRAELYTVFRVDPHRSADVLFEVLGKQFRGVLGCDQFSAYHRFMRTCDVRVQWCMAHLIREVKFLTTLPGVAAQAYGKRLRDALRALFAVIHEQEKQSESDSVFERKLQDARKHILEVGTQDVPANRYCENIAERLRVHGEGYFLFITTPGVGPTNNAAEQAIRFVIIDRSITQGTRSVTGQRWSERIWTVMATCVQQGRSVHSFLQECIRAHLEKTRKPSLVPTASQ